MVIKHISTTQEYDCQDALSGRHFLSTNVCINGKDIDIVARQELDRETIRHTFVNMKEEELEGLIQQLQIALRLVKDPKRTIMLVEDEMMNNVKKAIGGR